MIALINCANGDAAVDTITLGTDITLTIADNTDGTYGRTGLPIITSNIIIEGANHTLQRDLAYDCSSTENVLEDFRIFTLNGSSAVLTLNNTTLRNGCANDNGPTRGMDGGSILAVNGATLSINNSTITNSEAKLNGSAINIDNALDINNSTISHNVAGNSAAIISTATITIDNTMITDNFADYFSGGVYSYGANAQLNVINGSQFNNNTGDNAGGIYSEGNLVVIDSSFDNNRAQAGVGGAIASSGSGSTIISSSSFTNNTTSQRGAGIYSTAPLTVTSTLFDKNETDGTNYGGAIYSNDIDSPTVIIGSTFTANVAGAGGGIYKEGGSSLYIANSMFDSNTARTYHGGGIYHTHTGTLTIINSTISNNVALNPGGLGAGLTTGSPTTIIDTTISGNMADSNGGGIYAQDSNLTITNTTVSQNSATNGGGIYNANGNARVTNSTIYGNEASTNGGGVYIHLDSGTVQMYNNVIMNSSSGFNCFFDPVISGSNNLSDDPSCSSGGFTNSGTLSFTGLVDNGGSTLTHAPQLGSSSLNAGDATYLDETIVTVDLNGDGDQLDNLASDFDQRRAGFPRIRHGVVDVGAVEFSCGTFPKTVFTAFELIGAIECANIYGTADTIFLGANIDLTVENNSSFGLPPNGLPIIISDLTIEGQDFAINRSSGTFRILEVGSGTTLTLKSVVISNGYASANFGTSDHGGGIYTDGTLMIYDSSIVGNQADNDGGGIYVTNNGSLTLVNTVVSGNTASRGGGVVNTNGLVTITNTTFSDNGAIGAGGIRNEGTMTVSNSTFSGNSASHNGGSIDNVDGSMTITSSTFKNNSADISAGSIFNSVSGTLTLRNSILSGNYAHFGDGGGIANDGALTVVNSTISGNRANQLSGGGIFNWETGTLTLLNSIVWGNSAPSNPQIENKASLTAQNTAIQNFGAVNVTTNNGGNMSPGSGADIFVAPEPAANAPTSAGDYHLSDTSIVINQGDNSLIPANITTDFEGNPRIIDSIVDLGADEHIALPPVNTNLMYNGGFTKGPNQDAGWRFYGSIQHNVINGRMKLNFPTVVNGWMRQFRTQFPLRSGLRMVGWVLCEQSRPYCQRFSDHVPR